METRIREISSKDDKHLRIGIIPGHFATNHSHVNYYLDMTSLKCRHQMAKRAATQLAHQYRSNTPVDTIICMEGTEMIGAFLADELTQAGGVSMNAGKEICVLTPEVNVNNQMMLRDNIQHMVWNKSVLMLVASASTGKTIRWLMECIDYYSGRLEGICALFSAVSHVGDTPVYAVFTKDDFPHYQTYKPSQCEMCAKKNKIDALINSYGYSKI